MRYESSPSTKLFKEELLNVVAKFEVMVTTMFDKEKKKIKKLDQSESNDPTAIEDCKAKLKLLAGLKKYFGV